MENDNISSSLFKLKYTLIQRDKFICTYLFVHYLSIFKNFPS